MLELGNIKSAEGSEFDEVVDRTSPGAGAFSPYHSAPTIIESPEGFTDGVDAGQELFATYGDQWIPNSTYIQMLFAWLVCLFVMSSSSHLECDFLLVVPQSPMLPLPST